MSQEEPDPTRARAGNHPCSEYHVRLPVPWQPHWPRSQSPTGQASPGSLGSTLEAPTSPSRGPCVRGGLGLDPTTTPGPLTCQRPWPWPQALLGHPRPHQARQA